jgi:hypothetical protein
MEAGCPCATEGKEEPSVKADLFPSGLAAVGIDMTEGLTKRGPRHW